MVKYTLKSINRKSNMTNLFEDISLESAMLGTLFIIAMLFLSTVDTIPTTDSSAKKALLVKEVGTKMPWDQYRTYNAKAISVDVSKVDDTSVFLSPQQLACFVDKVDPSEVSNIYACTPYICFEKASSRIIGVVQEISCA